MITVTPIHVADFDIEGEVMPVYVHLIEHPEGRVLVDTGFTALHPAIEDMRPTLVAWDAPAVDMVVNTHLHFDHLGGNHRFPGVPVYVQRRELHDARTHDDYTISEWVEPPGVTYAPIDGEHELLPGVRLVPAPGHTDGSQIVVIEGERPVIIAGDTAVWFGELDEPRTEGQRMIVGMHPERVWLSHVAEPWRPSA